MYLTLGKFLLLFGAVALLGWAGSGPSYFGLFCKGLMYLGGYFIVACGFIALFGMTSERDFKRDRNGKVL